MSATAKASGASLTNSQVLILKALAKARGPVVRAALEKAAGVATGPENLGPVSKESVNGYADSLIGRKLVTVQQDDEVVGGVVFQATAAGKALAVKCSARKPSEAENVPAKSLDAAVLKVKAFKPYGLELYTDEDLKEIRALLPKDHQQVPLDALRQQIVNRRKQGAFTDPKAKAARKALSAVTAAVKAYWAGDGSLAEVEKAIKAGAKK